MLDPKTFVIVGAGLAGAKAAETLRAEGFEGRVVLVGEEHERPYERPALSKGYLRGETPRPDLFVHDDRFYAENRIDLVTGNRVERLDAEEHEVTLGDGERVRYDRLLLATGSAPRKLRVPGAHLEGVRYLRTLFDAEQLSRAIRDATSIAVVGAGWIGTEVAASARELGRPVTLVDPGPVPFRRTLGGEVGAFYRDLHAAHGVVLRLGTAVEAFRGSTRVEEVRLTDGSTVAADLVVVGVGASPRVELAAEAGLAVDDGIVVDEHLRTSAADVFAAGDVANAFHPVLRTRIRVEHWANALNQGPAAARCMLGVQAVYDRIPYFFSDQYDVGMQYSGHAASPDRVVFRGDPAERKFLAFWLDGPFVVAGMSSNIWDATDTIQDLVRHRGPLDVQRLRDADVPLEELAAAGTV